MIDGRQPLVLSYNQPKRVIQLLPVVQLPALQYLLHECVPAHFRMIKILIPPLQVPHRRVQARRSHRVKVRDADLERLPRLLLISHCIMFQDLRVIVAKMRVRHPQRLENILRRELPQGHPAYPLHDQAH